MKKIYISSILLILFVSIAYAGIPRYIQKGFSYCFDGKDTGIEKLLDIDGNYGFDFNAVYFYKNGLFVSNSEVFNNESMDLIKGIDLDKETKEALKNHHRWAEWGRYILCGDTIKVQYMQKPAALSAFNGAFESWYRIIDRETIEFLGLVKLEKRIDGTIDKDILNSYKGYYNKITKRPKSLIPPFDKAWILKEKWFWCDEKTRKEFMQNLKDQK